MSESIVERQSRLRQMIPRHTYGTENQYGKPVNERLREVHRLLTMFTYDHAELDLFERTLNIEREAWQNEMERRARYARGNRV